MSGEEPRVVGGTRRPDGTFRKERAVRPGYTPVDERPKYESKGTKFMKEVPKCPGWNEEAEQAEGNTATAGLSKSAKKNAKRKEKKLAEGGGEGGSSRPSSAAPSSAAPSRPASAAPAAAAPAPGPPADADKDKKARNLSKKVRQCQDLAEKKGKGEQLTPEQEDKLAKLEGLMAELALLQA